MRVALLGTLAVLAFAIPASSASAVELTPPWDPFDRCPVDAPEILAITDSGNACVSSVAETGSFKIGNTTVSTGHNELQFGAYGPGIPNVVGATLVADPVNVPGGLLGVQFEPIPMPPCSNPIQCALRNLAITLINRTRALLTTGPFAVTATVELAGEPSNFNLFAPFDGSPIITLPVKIHLQNPILGPNCYVGSNQDPIVLQPHQEPLSTFDELLFEPDPLGSNASFVSANHPGADQIDDAFTVPKANGCGLKLPFPPGQGTHLLNGAVNGRLGLPSPSGANKLVLEDATSLIVGSAPTGQELSDAWHAAVIP
jgi:hypothetical protein